MSVSLYWDKISSHTDWECLKIHYMLCLASVWIRLCVLHIFFFPFSYHLIHLQITQSALVGVTDLTYDLFKYFIWPTSSVITNVKDNIFKIVLSSNGDDLRDFKKQKSSNWEWHYEGVWVIGNDNNWLCSKSVSQMIKPSDLILIHFFSSASFPSPSISCSRWMLILFSC